jgi:porphyrinogen peroxidase
VTAPQPPPEPQPIVTPLRTAAIFLVLTIDPGGEDTVRDFLADASGLERAVGFRLPEGELSAVIGVGSDLWDRLFGGPRPAELHPFRELRGPRHFAPATPGDLLFHLRANQMDLCFEFASQVMNRLGGVATVVDEVHGFRYFDERDLMGFVDGTESPAAGPARKPPWSARRTRTSPAAATSSCRSTPTTWTAGTRCAPKSRNGSSGGTS